MISPRNITPEKYAIKGTKKLISDKKTGPLVSMTLKKSKLAIAVANTPCINNDTTVGEL